MRTPSAPRGAVMAEYLEYNRQYTYYNKLSQVNLRVVGDVFQLPAGPVQISPGAEVIWSQYETHATVGVSPAILAAIPTGVIGPSQSVARQSRRTQSVFFESVFPLIGNKWRPLPLESVDLNLGARWEGTDDSTDGTSPVAALRSEIPERFSCTPPRSRPPSAAPDCPRFSLLPRRRGAESGFLTFYANRPAWFRSLPFRGVLPWTSSSHSYPWLRCHSPHARLPR